MLVEQKKLIFQLSPEEKTIRLSGVLSDSMHIAALLNVPIIYRNELCVTPNLFVHKYPDGRKILVEQYSSSFIENTISVVE